MIKTSAQYQTLEDLLNDISDKGQVACAVFDSDDILQGISLNMCRCKCYYMLVHQFPNQCSIFDTKFVFSVLSAGPNHERICEYGCRLSVRQQEINGELYKIILFQYNRPEDDLRFNPNDNPAVTPLYHGGNTAAVDYFWKPNVRNINKINSIFEFIVKEMSELN